MAQRGKKIKTSSQANGAEGDEINLASVQPKENNQTFPVEVGESLHRAALAALSTLSLVDLRASYFGVKSSL